MAHPMTDNAIVNTAVLMKGKKSLLLAESVVQPCLETAAQNLHMATKLFDSYHRRSSPDISADPLRQLLIKITLSLRFLFDETTDIRNQAQLIRCIRLRNMSKVSLQLSFRNVFSLIQRLTIIVLHPFSLNNSSFSWTSHRSVIYPSTAVFDSLLDDIYGMCLSAQSLRDILWTFFQILRLKFLRLFYPQRIHAFSNFRNNNRFGVLYAFDKLFSTPFTFSPTFIHSSISEHQI